MFHHAIGSFVCHMDLSKVWTTNIKLHWNDWVVFQVNSGIVFVHKFICTKIKGPANKLSFFLQKRKFRIGETQCHRKRVNLINIYRRGKSDFKRCNYDFSMTDRKLVIQTYKPFFRYWWSKEKAEIENQSVFATHGTIVYYWQDFRRWGNRFTETKRQVPSW